MALGELQTTLALAGKQKQAAAAAFAAASAAVLLHLPMPEEMPPVGDLSASGGGYGLHEPLKQTRQVQDHLLAAWAAAALSQAQADCASNIPHTPLIVATPREQRKSPVPMNTTRVAAG